MKRHLPLDLLSLFFCTFFAFGLHAQIKMTPTQVGIRTDSPDFTLDVSGDLFVRSNNGAIMLGYPDNGNQWRMSTFGGGANILTRFKAEGSSFFSTRMVQFSNGDLAVGADPGNSTARLEVLQNSAIDDPQLLLTEQQNDFARLSFENTTYTDKRWTIAGYTGSSQAVSKMNFWFQDAGGGTDRFTIRGDGNIGISGSNPTARLHIHQQGQAVGQGLRFDDGVNLDWDITHGFGLRFHFGGVLRGFINATTGEYVQSSDSRLKKGIKQIAPVLPRVQQLQPVTYAYKDSKINTKTIGLVAQDVISIFPELVHYSNADEIYGINYAGFSVVAIKAIQELKSEMDVKDEHIADLEDRLARIEKLLAEGQTAQNYLILESPATNLDRADLKQNVPNPFESITTISYLIPEQAQRAQLRIADTSGKVLRSMDIEQRGRVQTTLDAAALPAGTYYYSLWLDGELIGTKKMVLSK